MFSVSSLLNCPDVESSATSLPTPTGINHALSVCTPPPIPLELDWPQNLPWLLFESRFANGMCPLPGLPGLHKLMFPTRIPPQLSSGVSGKLLDPNARRLWLTLPGSCQSRRSRSVLSVRQTARGYLHRGTCIHIGVRYAGIL